MTRFRIGFAVLAVALFVPTGLLVARALRGLEVEREVRHRVVADRVFDEMERALSAFLEEEENRPFGDYGGVLAGAAPRERSRSPLADPPAHPFVTGYFQVDPAGRVTSPERPRGGPGASFSPDVADRIAAVERTAGKFWTAGSDFRPGETARQQAPGSTIGLERKGAVAGQESFRDEGARGGSVSVYDALRSLNKGVEQRAGRQSKVLEEYLPGPSTEAAPTSGETPRDGGGREPRGRNERARLELSPMVGERVDAARLLLYRTAVHEERIYRQGLLLDVGKLGEWLGLEALGAGELAGRAAVQFVPAGAPSPVEGHVSFLHRFAAPFEDLTARLALAPLPGGTAAGAVYALAIAVLLAVGIGLVALYRMVAVALRYAAQRANFVAAVTHELRTPLTAIRMYGEMLRDGMVASQEKREQYHRHITAESERLTRLVDNVLEFSRLEKNARPVASESGSLDPVLRETAGLVRPHAEAEGFALRVEVEPNLPPVRFERDALLQMLFNLIDNAIKYANGASPKEIGLAARRDGDTVRLTVRDRGPGVPPRHLGRIFEPFYRGGDELTRRTKGTGIGLALVSGLARQMGARVAGRNLPEGGFEVALTFPVEP